VTIPEQRDEPSDATRFATRPKQRKTELVNATDNNMGKDRKKTVTKALWCLAAPTEADLKAGEWWPGFPSSPEHAHLEMVAGMWRQYGIEDDRTLDPETVAEQFTRAEREYAAAIHNRAVIREYGVAL
jgi:hypothetical protein